MLVSAKPSLQSLLTLLFKFVCVYDDAHMCELFIWGPDLGLHVCMTEPLPTD